MAKNRNKKKHVSDKVRAKKKEADKKVNPFEVKINRQKHQVLGKRITKSDKGMPGVSRSKAINKRKETLLVEYKQRGKVNKFFDRRIGEGNAEMSAEDKMLKRFAKERSKDKPGRFNLNDGSDSEEEELTHFGQSLSAIEKFEDPEKSDNEDDEEEKLLFTKMVGEEHFGGFMTKKEEELGPDGKPKTWKERMEEIMAKSKKEKYQRQREKMENAEKTEKLDDEFKELLGSVLKSGKAARDKGEQLTRQKQDDYDVTVRELMFEARGMATDRMKTDEEIAKEEKEKLDKLEDSRLRRMKGLTLPDHEEPKHRSADDLDDDFDYGVKSDKKVKFVAYKDGKMIQDSDEEEDVDKEASEKDAEDEDSDDESDAESVEDEGGDEQERGEEGSEEGEESDDDDAMQHLSDLESSDSETEATESKAKISVTKETSSKQKKGILKNFKEDLKKKKVMMDEARKELPYTFKAPDTYEDLVDLLAEHSEEDQLIIVDRLRKCHHPSLAEGNKQKLQKLFELLFEYLGEIVTQDPPQLRLADRLTVHLYQLCQGSPLECGTAVQALVMEKHARFQEYCEAHGGRGALPSLDLLMQLKLISQLFPTSDKRHPVVTPTTLFMSQLITQCPINTRRDIASGMFLCNLFLQYVSFSKRYVPEAINFLCGVLFLASKKDPKKAEPVIPPFKPFGKNVNFLELQKPKLASTIDIEPVKLSDVFSRSKSSHLSTDRFRLCTVHQAVKLLRKFAELYKELPSYEEIFKPVLYFEDKLPLNQYPAKLKDAVTDLSTEIKEHSCTQKLAHLVLNSAKPKPLKLYEPKFDEVFDGRKKRGGNKEQNEKKKLVHKHKREMKGAIREIRKDAQFIARQRLNDRMEKDAERKRKVKEIYGMLASQEGDYKALKRKK